MTSREIVFLALVAILGAIAKGLPEKAQKTSIVGYNKAKMTKDEKEKEKIRLEKVCKCKVEHLESVGAFILTYDNPSHASTGSLALDPSKEIGMEDQIVTISNEVIPTDPEYDQQWALQDLSNNADINAAEGWKKYMLDSKGGDPNGPSVVVAVIDTGVDYNHKDLRDVMWTNTGEIPGNGQDDDGNGYVDDVYGYDFHFGDADPIDIQSHGTHCAGIIAAKENNGKGIAGVASFAQGKVKIMAVKGLSDDRRASGSVANLFKCLNYAIANGATISSNSWGGGKGLEQLWKMVLQNNPDHLFVAAAGNSDMLFDDKNRPLTCGIKEPNLLCVAASTKQDTRWSSSNYGKDYVHVFAPGSNIYSTLPGNGYGTKSGTSMACPHVSGLAALIRTMQPDMNAQQVRELIEANVQKKPQYENIVSSGGLIDMGKTLKGTCDASNWPDLDHGLTCGDCKGLINEMSSKYITCNNYCKSIDRSCSGAWEESDDSCKVQSTETCAHRFTYTSDAICECGPTLSGTSCDASNWPDLDHALTCGDCKALINKMSSKYITCNNYCKSIDRSCSGSWEESDDSCKVQATETCAHRFTYTSDAICECGSTLSGTTCDASKWPDLDHGLICGNCKALINKMSSKYITCNNYCKSIDRSCSGAWEESDDSCKVQATETCAHRFTYTSDAICECGPTLSGTTCDASNWPDLDHGLTCGNCKALINKMSSKYITCNKYCKSIDRSCSGAWEESDDSCKVQATETCAHQFTYTSDAICECGPTLSG